MIPSFRAIDHHRMVTFTGIFAGLAGPLAAYLIYFRSRRSNDGKPGSYATDTPSQNPAWQQGQLPLGEPTRFIDSPKRKPFSPAQRRRAATLSPARRSHAQHAGLRPGRRRPVGPVARPRRSPATCPDGRKGRRFRYLRREFRHHRCHRTGLAKQPWQQGRLALYSLGIPLIVFRPNDLPDTEAISREIADAIVRCNRLEAARC